jgi:hypothetical protein
MDTLPNKPLDPRCRETHPERIAIGDEVFVRNDVRAKECAMSVRSLNRSDAEGAPYRFFGGVKYRPHKRHDEFLLKTIQVDKPHPRTARIPRAVGRNALPHNENVPGRKTGTGRTSPAGGSGRP